MAEDEKPFAITGEAQERSRVRQIFWRAHKRHTHDDPMGDGMMACYAAGRAAATEDHERKNQTQAPPPEPARHQAIDVGDRGEEERDLGVPRDATDGAPSPAHVPAAEAPAAKKHERLLSKDGELHVVKQMQDAAHRFSIEIMMLGRQLQESKPLCYCGHTQEDHEHIPSRPQCRYRSCRCGKYSLEAPPAPELGPR